MKNLFLASFLVVFIAGCATSSKPKAYMNTSTPIFILKKPKTNAVHVEFQDLSHKENDIASVVANALTKEGFMVVADKEHASILIKGALHYLKQEGRENTRGFVSVGFGFGSGGKRSSDVGFGMSHRVGGSDGWNNLGSQGYRYDGQASLLIRVREGVGFENYTTNLNFLTEENTYSLNYARNLFNEQIANQIVQYLKF